MIISLYLTELKLDDLDVLSERKLNKNFYSSRKLKSHVKTSYFLKLRLKWKGVGTIIPCRNLSILSQHFGTF